MQKWQKDKAQLLAFPAKCHVNLNVQLYREVCSQEVHVLDLENYHNYFSSKLSVPRGELSHIWGHLIYLDNLDEQNKRNMWLSLSIQIHMD
jgi:hypothetical protein